MEKYVYVIESESARLGGNSSPEFEPDEVVCSPANFSRATSRSSFLLHLTSPFSQFHHTVL